MTREEAIDQLLAIGDTGLGADKQEWSVELHSIVDKHWPSELLGFSDDGKTWFTPIEVAYRLMEVDGGR